jgi:hypothetical protein
MARARTIRGTSGQRAAYSFAVLSDRPELSQTVPELDALVVRIHERLRKERRARRWREGAAGRHKAMVAMMGLFAPLAVGLYLSGIW